MTYLMKPGDYFVGDPCYAIPNEKWNDFLAAHDCSDDNLFGFEEQACWFDETAYGDGCWRGSNGKNYSVDAGIIGVVPIELATKYSAEKMANLGSIENFKLPFFVKSNNGIFEIGSKIVINTGETA